MALGVTATTIGCSNPVARVPQRRTELGDIRIVDVKSWGARGDGIADDSEAIQHAMAASEEAHATLRFPRGTYRITRPIRPEHDGLVIDGAGAALLVVDPPPGALLAEGVLVNAGGEAPHAAARVVRRVSIRDLEIVVLNGSDGPISQGVIQLNACEACSVERVRMTYKGGLPKPRQIDGIVFARGSSGLIRDVMIDGLPKAGIYVAPLSHDVEIQRAEVRGSDGAVGRSGFLIAADHVQVLESTAHHNAGDGLVLGVVRAGADGELVAASHVLIDNCTFADNGGAGLLLSSAYAEARPHDITIRRTISTRNSTGFQIEAGEAVSIDEVVGHHNGASGILVDAKTEPFIPPELRVRSIAITNVDLYDNGQAVQVGVGGITVRSARGVHIDGARIHRTPGSTGSQVLGVQVEPPDLADVLVDGLPAGGG